MNHHHTGDVQGTSVTVPDQPTSPAPSTLFWKAGDPVEQLQGAVVFLAMTAFRHYTDEIADALHARGAAVRLVHTSDAVKATDALQQARCLVTFHSCVTSILGILNDLRGKVPTLTLQDGIIEYQHSSVVFADGTARYRPLASDRIAVFGDASARLLRAMGVAPDRIHVTGSSRITLGDADRFPGTGDILIATANKPGYSQAQLVAFYRLLDRTVTTLAASGHRLRFRFGRGLKPDGLCAVELFADTLGQDMVNRIRSLPQSTAPLEQDLRESRAVITTASTLSIEAMAQGLPVAHLSYDDDTAFLHPAWQIRPDSDACSVLQSMLEPTPLQKMYQLSVLHDNLRPGPATDRIADLILDGAR